MADRTVFVSLYVQGLCDAGTGELCWHERVEEPTPDQQAALIRHAKAHARKTGHRVNVERGQTAGVEA